jgi:pilus assembly protein CpaF
VDEEGYVIGELQATGIVPSFHRMLARKGVDIPVELFEPNYAAGGGR